MNIIKQILNTAVLLSITLLANNLSAKTFTLPSDAGLVIILNGAPGSGKSSIAKELKNIVRHPCNITSIGKYVKKSVNALDPENVQKLIYFNLRLNFLDNAEVPTNTETYQELFNCQKEILSGIWNEAQKNLNFYLSEQSRQGNNIIVEHVINLDKDFEGILSALKDTPVAFIKINCSPKVIQEREQIANGWGVINAEKIHHNKIYDLEINSEKNSIEECAQQIKAYLKTHPNFTIFKTNKK